jgi:hypothetical protein
MIIVSSRLPGPTVTLKLVVPFDPKTPTILMGVFWLKRLHNSKLVTFLLERVAFMAIHEVASPLKAVLNLLMAYQEPKKLELLKFATGATSGQLQSTEPQRRTKANKPTSFNFKVILALDTFETSFGFCPIYSEFRSTSQEMKN